MPRVTKFNMKYTNTVGVEIREMYNVCVDKSGMFYVNISASSGAYLTAKSDVKVGPTTGDKTRISSPSFVSLIDALESASAHTFAAKVTTERVILFNVETHASFAEDETGYVVPNAGYPGAQWNQHVKFGSHHAADKSHGGYSLTIGARIYNKKTETIGEHSNVTYHRYEGKLHSKGDRLNNWTSFSLNMDSCREIPYSDEAAEFFYNMMLSMVTVIKHAQALVDMSTLSVSIREGALLTDAPRVVT